MSRRPATINEPFASLPASLLESAAFQALSWDAMRVLLRLMREHLRHGGHGHDRLICTYSDFAAAGIRQRSIAAAIRDCVALGLLEVTKQGAPSISTRRQPSQYRLTFLGGRSKGGYTPPTEEWRSISDPVGYRATSCARGSWTAGQLSRQTTLHGDSSCYAGGNKN